MARDNFLFYKSWSDVMGELPNAVRLEVYDAVTRYAFGEPVQKLTPLAQIAFAFIKQDIDRANENYEKKAAKNRVNGGKGGRPKSQKDSHLGKTQQNPENPHGFSETQQNPKEKEKEKEKDKDITELVANAPNSLENADAFSHSDLKNQKGKGGVGENPAEAPVEDELQEPPVPPIVKPPPTGKKLSLDDRRERFRLDLSQYLPTYGRDMLNEFYAYWTELNKSQTAMRWEGEKTWETSRRLKRWSKNNFGKYGTGNSKNDRGAVSDEFRERILRDIGAI